MVEGYKDYQASITKKNRNMGLAKKTHCTDLVVARGHNFVVFFVKPQLRYKKRMYSYIIKLIRYRTFLYLVNCHDSDFR